MAFSLDKSRAITRELARKVEDFWIEKEAFRDLLVKHADALEQTVTAFKSDPEMRSRARQVFAKVSELLDAQRIEALTEDLLEKFPPRDKSN
jgi:hypothetical protein